MDCVPGAVLFLLDSLADLNAHLLRNGVHGRGDLVTLVANHGNEVVRVHASGSMQGVGQQAAPADFVQRLLPVRLHAGSGASCEDNYGTLLLRIHAAQFNA
ncbi:hypothetical protein GCM10009537_18260 [Corynebacterium riegelii]